MDSCTSDFLTQKTGSASPAGSPLTRRQENMFDQNYEHLPHALLTGTILKCCFDVMDELGSGFLESIYKNALVIALKQSGLTLDIEKLFEVYFRQQRIGLYIADLVVNSTVIVELKCCKSLLREHQAQTINYLAAADLPVGLLVNFGHRNLEYKRVYHPLFSCRRVSGDPAGEADPVFLEENKQ